MKNLKRDVPERKILLTSTGEKLVTINFVVVNATRNSHRVKTPCKPTFT